MNHLATLSNDGQSIYLTKAGELYLIAIADVETPEKLLATIKRLAGLAWVSASHIRELILEVELSTVTREEV